MHLSAVLKLKVLVLVTTHLLLIACSGHKTISRDELRSQLTSAASIAAEAETFIDYIREDRAPRSYAEGHITFLVVEVDRSSKELEKAAPEVGIEPQFLECREQLHYLGQALRTVRPLASPDELPSVKERITLIRKALEEAKSTL